jgi:hypothetical protein
MRPRGQYDPNVLELQRLIIGSPSARMTTLHGAHSLGCTEDSKFWLVQWTLPPDVKV